jgi:hypothetical protein
MDLVGKILKIKFITAKTRFIKGILSLISTDSIPEK